MIGHQEDQVVLDREERGFAVARRHAGSGQGSLELIRTYVAAVAPHGMQLIGEGTAIGDRHQGVKGHRLARARLFAADLEFTTRAGAQVAVAGRVDEDRRRPGLSARLRFCDDGGQSSAVAVGGDDTRVQLDLHAGGYAKLFQDELHLLGVVGHAIDSVACDGIALAEATHEFLIEAGFIEIEQVAQQRGGPDASKRPMAFEETDLGTGPGGGDGCGHASWTRAADDDVTVGRERNVALGFVQEAGFRARGGGDLRERAKGA